MSVDHSNVAEKTPPDTMPLAFRVVRGSLWVAGSSYISLIYGFLANLILVHLLAKTDFGVFAMAQFIFMLVNLRPKTGIGPAFAQRKETTPTLVATHLGLDVTAGLLTLLVCLGMIPLLHLFGTPWAVIWIVLAFGFIGVSDSVMGTAWTLLDKMLQLRVTSIVSTIAFVLSYPPAIVLAWRHGGYWSLVVQNALYALLLLAGLWWAARRAVPDLFAVRWRLDHETARTLLRFGVPIGLTTVTGLLVSQLDNFLVGTLVGYAALGAYTRAYNLAQWPSRIVTNVVSQAAFYTYARLQDDQARLQRAVTMSLWLITTLALPIALAIFAAAPDLVRQLYGPQYADSGVYLRFLVIYAVIGPLLGDAGWLFIAVGRPRLSLHVTVTQTIALGVVGLLLTPHFGVVGTCTAVGLAFIAGLLLTYLYVRRLVSLPLWSSIGIPVALSMLVIGGYVSAIRMVDPSAMWPLPLAIVVKMAYAALAYVGLLYVVRPRQTRERLGYVIDLARARRRPLLDDTANSDTSADEAGSDGTTNKPSTAFDA